ncbi:hypothetical protein DHB64_05250 [Antarcticibacterium sp. W02-3]|nr:hypothetical protein [Antarcticibacterium sp. W02-3]
MITTDERGTFPLYHYFKIKYPKKIIQIYNAGCLNSYIFAAAKAVSSLIFKMKIPDCKTFERLEVFREFRDSFLEFGI